MYRALQLRHCQAHPSLLGFSLVWVLSYEPILKRSSIRRWEDGHCSTLLYHLELQLSVHERGWCKRVLDHDLERISLQRTRRCADLNQPCDILPWLESVMRRDAIYADFHITRWFVCQCYIDDGYRDVEAVHHRVL